MNTTKVSPGQCLNFGARVAEMLNALGVDRRKTQTVIDSPSHVVWGEIELILQRHLVVPEGQRQKILEDVASFVIPDQPEFVAAKKFGEASTRVKFSSLTPRFVKHFLPVVTCNSRREVIVRKLLVDASPLEITEEINRVPRVLGLSHLYWMLEQQPEGEKPDDNKRHLLVDGFRNISEFLA